MKSIVLVEGESDRAAILVLAERLDHDLTDVDIISMNGATNIAKFVRRYGPSGDDARLIGLCDVGEAVHFATALSGLPGAEFFVCERDLEDELLRAIGPERTVAFIEAQGELKTFRTMQRQPAQRDRTIEEHLHRFCGIRSGRKKRYAAGLAAELDLDALPPPLAALIAVVQVDPK